MCGVHEVQGRFGGLKQGDGGRHEEGGRCCLSGAQAPAQAQRGGPNSGCWSLQSHVSCRRRLCLALSDLRGAAPGAEAQPHPLWPPLDAGILIAGPPEEPLLPGVPAFAPEDVWSPAAGRGAPGAQMPSPVPSIQPEARSLCSRPSCALWLQDPAPPRVGRWGGPGRRLPPVPPPARGPQPGLITSHPPPLTPLLPGGLGGRGRGVF